SSINEPHPPSTTLFPYTTLFRSEEKTYMIREAIAAGHSQYGMQTFDQSLFNLFQSGLITLDEAYRNATNADEFRMRASGILSAEQAVKDIDRIGHVSNAPAQTRPELKEVKA